MFKIDVTNDLDSLLADESRWNALARGVPFRETSWLGPWWRRFRIGRQPFIVVARDEAQVVRGILPLYRERQVASSRSLSMLGDGLAFSDYVSVLASHEDATAVAEAMGGFLGERAGDREFGWDVIHIDGVVEGDPAMAAFAAALESRGVGLHAQSRMSTWYRAAESDWEAHLKTFGKTQRRKMRRWTEKIASTDGLEKIVADSSESVESLLNDTIDLHQRRWRESGETGSYADPRFCEFMHEACQDLFNRGRLHLPTINWEGKTIAAELHFIGGDRNLYCYSSGYDIEAAEMEPGRLLAAETLRDLYRNNYAGIDYLRGDEPYKQRMSAHPRRVFQLRAVSPNWLPRLRHAAWCTQFELKQWVRRRTGRTPIEVADLTAICG